MKGLGQLPPQAIELEQAVLGAIMESPNAILPVMNILNAESFYVESHGKIFTAIVSLYSKSQPYDLLSVSSELKKQGTLESIGGPYYLTELTRKVVGSTSTEFHATIIEQCSIRREIIRLSSEAAQNAYDDTNDVFGSLLEHQTKLFNLLKSHNGRTIHSIGTITQERLKEYRKPAVNGLTGVGTGFAEFDKITGGMQKANLIIVAARPGMGKTAFAMQVAKNAESLFDTKVGFFELEMSKESLTDRMISNHTSIYQDKIQKRELTEYDFQQIDRTITSLINAKIFIDDSPMLTVMALRSKALQLKQKHDIGLLIVDYLQLMTGSKSAGNREQVISEISRGLKVIAKELDIPVIALSQLSRQVENRPGGNKRPMLSDLRESGSIEQDADMVMFLYRPEYYGIEHDENNESTIGLNEVIIAKNRHGICDTFKLDFNGAFMRFKNWGETPKPMNNIRPSVDYSQSNFTIQPSLMAEQDEPPF
ncbi:MAG: Replicative helicase [Segetibacter sp.]|nr:Replicative helicase [Segetibacter sp.]